MLYYTHNLKNKINNIIPKLVIGNKWKIVGSFVRNIKYVTDVDVNNNIEHINNISKKIINNVTSLPDDTIFLYLTSGENVNYKVPWTILNEHCIKNYNKYTARKFAANLKYKKLITIDEYEKIFINITQKPNIAKLLLIEQIIYRKKKIRWTKKDIINQYKIINNKKITLINSIKKNEKNILHYIIKYNYDYVPIDIGLMKTSEHKYTFNKVKYLSYVNKEYYYILQGMMKFFINNKIELQNIIYLLTVTYGPYIQILMNLFYLNIYGKYKILTIHEYIKYYKKILKKIKKHTDYDSELIEESHKYIHNNNKMSNIIDKIENDILLYLNNKVKNKMYYYYNLLKNKKKLRYFHLLNLEFK